jgi:hypothetical protein
MVGGVNTHVLEAELIHFLRKNHGDGPAPGRSRHPDFDPASPRGEGDHMVGRMLQGQLIAHKKGEGHYMIPYYELTYHIAELLQRGSRVAKVRLASRINAIY